MQKGVLIFLFSSIILFSCTREEKAVNLPPPASPEAGAQEGTVTPSPGNAPPEVTFGAIVPARPASDTRLGIQYSGHDPEGDTINFRFRWYVDNELVQDGPSGILEPGKCKKGSEVYVEIIPSDAFSSGRPFKTASVVIINRPPVVSSIAFNPLSVSIGSAITAIPTGSDPDGDDIQYAYQWKVNRTTVNERKASNEFNTKGLHKKDIITVIVTPSDKESEGMPIESGGILLSNSAPQITSTPKYDVVNGVYSYQVTATDPDGDKLTYILEKSPPGMTINPSSGLIRWDVPKQVAEKQDAPIKITVDDGDGGKAFQEFSLTLEMK